ncbi:Tn3 family transposase [Nocardia sp. NPDC057663]|uniref:Tn3 family transposase n=1 Tax=Nocardia sp. NPDC057663 TaxID=3346201 RepID=UPI0036724134
MACGIRGLVPYRREGRAQANLTEGRLGLGHNIFHGRKDEIAHACLDGIENQLSALGLILNCVVLWNSVYLDRARRAQDYPVRDEDAARLSAFIRKHIRLQRHYSFHLPDLGGAHPATARPGHPRRGRLTSAVRRQRAVLVRVTR